MDLSYLHYPDLFYYLSYLTAEWLIENQSDDNSLVKDFWKARGGRPKGVPKASTWIAPANWQLGPSDTEEEAYRHPKAKAKRARKKMRDEIRRDKMIVRRKADAANKSSNSHVDVSMQDSDAESDSTPMLKDSIQRKRKSNWRNHPF